MRRILFLSVVMGGLASNAGYAQQIPQAAAKTAPKPNSGISGNAPIAKRGSIGGQVNKGANISGTDVQRKH